MTEDKQASNQTHNAVYALQNVRDPHRYEKAQSIIIKSQVNPTQGKESYHVHKQPWSAECISFFDWVFYNSGDFVDRLCY